MVYVSHADSNDVYVFRLNRTNGEVTLVQKAPIPGVVTAGTSTPMALSPDRRILYVGTRGDPKAVTGFAIDPETGRLSHIGGGPLPEAMAYLSTDRSGRFLFGASYPGHAISVSPISSPGVVGPAHQVLKGYPNAHSILADATNRRVFALTLGNDRVNTFVFDPEAGTLSPAESSSLTLKGGTGPRHLLFRPGARLLYVLGELDGAVHVLAIDAASGALREIQSVSAIPPSFQGKPSAADLHITPDGRFLYTSDRATNTLAGFTVAPDSGTLSVIGHAPTETTPRSFAIDPTGQFLLAVGQASHQMSVYRIDAVTGALARIQQLPVGKNPNWIEIVDRR